MAMTLKELAEVAQEAGIELRPHDDGSYLWAHFKTRFYESQSHESRILELHFLLSEDGEFLHILAINLHELADCPNREAVFEAILAIAFDTKSVAFEYQAENGRLHAMIEMPLEDNRLVPDQFESLCRIMVLTVDGYDSVIRHAMRTGTVDMTLEDKPLPDPSKQELNELLAKIGGLEGLKKLAGRDRTK